MYVLDVFMHRPCLVITDPVISLSGDMQRFSFALVLNCSITFIILNDTSELRTSEGRFLNDPANSRLFEKPDSNTENNQEYKQEPAQRKRKLQPNK